MSPSRRASAALILVLLSAALAAGEAPAAVPGLSARYHGDAAFTPLVAVSAIDPGIDFAWGAGSPHGLPDAFSVHWSGSLTAPASGTWTIQATSDDGIMVFIDGQLVVRDWNDHTARIARGSVALQAGRAVPIEVLFYDQGGEAAAHVAWEGPGTPLQTIPTSALGSVLPPPSAPRLPGSSAVSPACIEFGHPRGAELAATSAAGTLAIAPLSQRASYIEVDLQPGAPTAVGLEIDGQASGAAIAWQPTELMGEAALSIRQHDSLLFRAMDAGTWSVASSSGDVLAPEPIAAGAERPYRFDQPGIHLVRAWVGDEQVATLAVTVVAVDLSKPLAGEVSFIRQYPVVVTPASAQVSFTSADDTLVGVHQAAREGGEVTLAVQPIQRGTPRVVARLGGAEGPILAVKEVEEFTLDIPALFAVTVALGTDTGTSVLVMRPFVADQWFTFDMFAHRSTFRGGARRFTINTDHATSSLGEPGFRRRSDPATNETIGTFEFTLEVPPDASMYCYTLRGSQIASPEYTNTETYYINGDVCHVGAQNTLIFTRALNSREDEVAETNGEAWASRSWNVLSSSFCEAGDHGDAQCDVTYRLRVSDPPPLTTRLDNPIPALFGGTRTTSDCRDCGTACSAMTPSMDTGTIPGRYTTSAEVCSTANNDLLGSSSGGIFHVSKLDAHGLAGDTHDRFPDFAETVRKRQGTVYDPVIRMDAGGDGAFSGCSLYGWTGGGVCPPMNTWTFTAVARDPDDSASNIPSPYSIRWRLTNGDHTLGEVGGSQIPMPGVPLDSRAETVTVQFGVGRWYPRLEVWHRDPMDGVEVLVGIAEIHSLAVETFPASNVPRKDDDVATRILAGTPFHVTNHAGGQAVDARLGILGPPGGISGLTVRGRVSLDGYRQNEYWVTANDIADLPQVVQVPDSEAQRYYLQGYQLPSNSREDLTLTVEGQALIETCAECNRFLGTPVTPVWQVTDEEAHNNVSFEIHHLSKDSGDVQFQQDWALSRPAPAVTLSGASIQVGSVDLDGRVSGSIQASGAIDSRLCDITPGAAGTIDSIQLLRGSPYADSASPLASGSVSSDKQETGELPKPYDYQGSYSIAGSVGGLRLGQNIFSLLVEDKVLQQPGLLEFSVQIERVGAHQPTPGGPLASLGTISQPIAATLDLSGLGGLRRIHPMVDPVSIIDLGGARGAALADRFLGEVQSFPVNPLAGAYGRWDIQDGEFTPMRIDDIASRDERLLVLNGGERRLDLRAANGALIRRQDLGHLPAGLDGVLALAGGETLVSSAAQRTVWRLTEGGDIRWSVVLPGSVPSARLHAAEVGDEVVVFDETAQVGHVLSRSGVLVRSWPLLLPGFTEPATLVVSVTVPAAFDPAVADTISVHLGPRGPLPGDALLRETGGRFLRSTWGTAGAETGQFAGPAGLAVDSQGYVHVVDAGNQRVQTFNAQGAFIHAWGMAGTGDAQFAGPGAIASGPGDRLLVVDAGNGRVQEFDVLGGHVRTFGGSGSAAPLVAPTGVAVAADGGVWVTDAGADTVRRYAADGTYLASVGEPGGGPGQLLDPSGIAIAANGDLLIADLGNSRIQRWDADGGFIAAWGSATGPDPLSPAGVAVASDGSVVVLDAARGLARRFAADGTPLPEPAAGWGSPVGFALTSGSGLAVGGDGTIFVADTGNQRIQAIQDAGDTDSLVFTGTFLGAPLQLRLALRTSGEVVEGLEAEAGFTGGVVPDAAPLPPRFTLEPVDPGGRTFRFQARTATVALGAQPDPAVADTVRLTIDALQPVPSQRVVLIEDAATPGSLVFSSSPGTQAVRLALDAAPMPGPGAGRFTGTLSEVIGGGTLESPGLVFYESQTAANRFRVALPLAAEPGSSDAVGLAVRNDQLLFMIARDGRFIYRVNLLGQLVRVDRVLNLPTGEQPVMVDLSGVRRQTLLALDAGTRSIWHLTLNGLVFGRQQGTAGEATVTLRSLVDPSLAPISTRLVASGRADFALIGTGDDDVALTIDSDRALIQDNPALGERFLPVTLDIPAWGLGGHALVLRERGVATDIYASEVYEAEATFAADLSTLQLRLRRDGSPFQEWTLARRSALVYTAPGGPEVTLERLDPDPGRADALNLGIVGAFPPSPRFQISVLESGPATLAFGSALIPGLPGGVGGDQVVAEPAVVLSQRTEEDFNPYVIRIKGVFGSEELVEIDYERGTKKAKRNADGNYYLVRTDRDDIAVYFMSPFAGLDEP